MEQILTIRQREILGILNSASGWISGKAVSAKLRVTDRTIRNDIQVLNDYLKQFHAYIESIRGKGYLLHTSDPGRIQELTYSSGAMLSPEDRLRELVLYLIEQDEAIPLGELEDMFFVSRSTLESDLKAISASYSFEKPYLALIRSGNAVAFEENEQKRRFVWMLLCTGQWNYNYEAGIKSSVTPLPAREMEELRKVIRQCFYEAGIRMGEADYIAFQYSAGISVYRIRKGHVLKKNTAFGSEREQAAAKKICSRLGELLNLSFPEEECISMGSEICFRRQFDEGHPAEGFWEKHEQSLFAEIINQVFKEIDREYVLFLSDKPELKNELLYILIKQYHNPFHLGIREKELRMVIQTSYPEAVGLACHFIRPVAAGCGMIVTTGDLLEIAAGMANALEQMADGIRVALISHLDFENSRLLMAQIHSCFGSKITLKGPYSIHEAAEILDDSFSFALSTTKTGKLPLSIPLVQIAPLMSKESIEEMNYQIQMAKYRRMRPQSRLWIPDFFRKEWFETDCRFSSADDFYQQAEETLRKKQLAGADYLMQIRKNSAFVPVAFDGGFMLAYTFGAAAEENGIYVWKTKKLFQYDGYAEQWVFLIMLREENRYDDLQIYGRTVLLLRRISAMGLLPKITDFDTFFDIVKAIEKIG